MSAPNFNSAPALSRPAPEPLKCEGPGHHPEADAENRKAEQSEYAYGSAADQALKADAKRIACAAIAGIELVRLGDGTWLAHKLGMFRPLATDEDADAWLQRVGAPG